MTKPLVHVELDELAIAGNYSTEIPNAAAHEGFRPGAATSHRLRRRVNGLFKAVRNEPLAHFLLIGFIAFIVMQAFAQRADTSRIEVTPAHVRKLARDYALQFGGPPDAATLEALVGRDIHDEILFREGLALGLDKGDEIVRRRIVQKEQFLLNADAPAEPTTSQLQAYYDAHPELSATPATVTFSHIYFDGAPSGDAAAERRARQALAHLSAAVTRAPDLGDPFPDLYDFSNYDQQQVLRLFGHTPLAEAVFAAPVGRWEGPLKSAYGWHLVRVSARALASQRPLAQVRDQIRTAWLQDAQDQAGAAAYAALARRFTVIRDDRRGQP
jgi:hypothetical protein